MPPFGRKANRDIQRFGKKLGIKRNFGRKLVNTIEKVGSVIGRVADIASLVNPELGALAGGAKTISSQAGGLARSGVALTGKRPNYEEIEGQINVVKQGAKDIKAARDVLQKKKPAVMEEDSGIEFRD